MAKRFPTFKPYNQHQIMMLPPSLEELISKDHPVRIVNDVINSVNIEPLLSAYRSTGTSSYHPQMLLKILVYGYVTNIYSSRKLEVACKENINLQIESVSDRLSLHKNLIFGSCMVRKHGI